MTGCVGEDGTRVFIWDSNVLAGGERRAALCGKGGFERDNSEAVRAAAMASVTNSEHGSRRGSGMDCCERRAK